MVFTHIPKKAELFTGIIQGKGEILFSKQFSDGLKLRVLMNELGTGLELGASVAVSGVCLTVVNFQGAWAEFDVIQETLDRSNLEMLQVGSHTNIDSFIHGWMCFPLNICYVLLQICMCVHFVLCCSACFVCVHVRVCEFMY